MSFPIVVNQTAETLQGQNRTNSKDMHATSLTETTPQTQFQDTGAWTLEKAQALHDAPFNNLLFLAQTVHRPEFRSQKGPAQPASQHQDRRMPGRLRLLQPVGPSRNRPEVVEADGGPARVIAEATKARDACAIRYCMGAAWRNPRRATWMRSFSQFPEQLPDVLGLDFDLALASGELAERAPKRDFDHWRELLP